MTFLTFQPQKFLANFVGMQTFSKSHKQTIGKGNIQEAFHLQAQILDHGGLSNVVLPLTQGLWLSN